MDMGFAPTSLHQVSPLFHMTTLTTGPPSFPVGFFLRHRETRFEKQLLAVTFGLDKVIRVERNNNNL